MHLTYRKTCRICGSAALTPVISLGAQHLQGSFLKPGLPTPPLRRIPVELVRCDPVVDQSACGLLQTSVTVPPAILYSSYWYRSGTNQTMRNHLKGIAEDAATLIQKEAALVLDIGCNDGTLLECYPETFRRFGIDPSNLALEVEGDIEVIQDFFPSERLGYSAGPDGFDAITSIAMFYDLEEPRAFVEAVGSILNKDGIWIFEMAYMPSMLEMNSYDTICHEHLEYYSFSVVENLLRSCGLRVIRVAFNDINGGSIRCYATHADSNRRRDRESVEAIERVRRAEFELELDTNRPYRHFQERIDGHRVELGALLRDLKRAGETIHVYGASTKGNTILQWCGIDGSIIDCASDRNPDKDGARTIGTNIPIVSEEKSRALKPDYYLVLPWHFREEFLAREATLLEQGTKFIFPLPEIQIVDQASSSIVGK
jgi:SAM-dependent methyltransferase